MNFGNRAYMRALLYTGMYVTMNASQQPVSKDVCDQVFAVMRNQGYFSLAVIAPETYRQIFQLAECRLLKEHASNVSCLAYSPDGKQLLTGDIQGSLCIFDPATGNELKNFKSNPILRCLAFNPAGDRSASGYGHPKMGNNNVRIWDSKTGHELKVLEHKGFVDSIAFSPEGNQLASGSSDGTVRFWNPETGTQLKILQGHTDYCTCVAYSPDGEELASASFDRTVRLWDLKTGEQLRTLDTQAQQKAVQCLAYSRNSKQLAVGSSDGIVRIWNPKTGEQLKTLDATNNKIAEECCSVNSIAYNHNGDQLACGYSNRIVRLWHPRTGEQLKILDAHVMQGIRCVAYSHDNSQLACGSGDGTVQLWNLALEKFIRACSSLSLKEIMLVDQICQNIAQNRKTALSVYSCQARIFAILPKPIRNCLACHVYNGQKNGSCNIQNTHRKSKTQKGQSKNGE